MPFSGPGGGADPTNPELTLPYILLEFIGTETVPPAPIVLTGIEFVGDEISGTTYSYYIIGAEILGMAPPPDFNVVITQPNIVTIRSSFPDMFDRLIKYLKYSEDNTDIVNNYNVKTYGSVTRFSELPENFTAVYEYRSPPATTKPITIRVNHYLYSSIGGPSGGGGTGSAPWGTGNPIGNPAYDSYITYTDWTFTLDENYELVNQYFLASVSNGTFSKNAKTVYPELN